MLPGVVVTGAEDYIEKGFEPGDAVSVVPTNSSWPVAVGHALVSSSTLLGAEGIQYENLAYFICLTKLAYCQM